jgi:hypothetical protein
VHRHLYLSGITTSRDILATASLLVPANVVVSLSLCFDVRRTDCISKGKENVLPRALQCPNSQWESRKPVSTVDDKDVARPLPGSDNSPRRRVNETWVRWSSVERYPVSESHKNITTTANMVQLRQVLPNELSMHHVKCASSSPCVISPYPCIGHNIGGSRLSHSFLKLTCLNGSYISVHRRIRDFRLH